MDLERSPQFAALTTEALQLEGDEILGLVQGNNPDGGTTGVNWLAGPAPMNFWRTYFSRTLVRPRDHGRVHIMVVNTENAYTLTDDITGHHWILLAWYIEPAGDGAGAGG